ncbi:unnamed protein product, partial [Laminaria digitata]
MFVFRPVWSCVTERWVPIAWIGPEETLSPQPRKSLNDTDKNLILRRHKGKCNCCDTNVVLYPYSNADADHIIPISLEGESTMDNFQLLCTVCHRHKTAMDDRRMSAKIRVVLPLRTRDTYVIRERNISLP